MANHNIRKIGPPSRLPDLKNFPMSRPRHLSRLMVSPSVHVVYLFQSSLSLSQSSPEGGIGFGLALEHLFKRRSFVNDQFEEYAGSANSVSSCLYREPLTNYVIDHA